MKEQQYINYLAHMLDESCNEKGISEEDINEATFEFVPLDKNRSRSSSKPAGQKSGSSGGWNKNVSYKNLKNMTQEEAVKKGIDIDMWYAAQLPPPREDIHGRLGGCQIVDSIDRHNGYLKTYIVSGYYEDGSMFETDQVSNRKILAYYINLHEISINTKEWDKFKNQLPSFEKQLIAAVQNQKINRNEFGFELEIFPDNFTVVDVVSFSDGFYLKKLNSNKKLGPFQSKNIAKKYAQEHHYDSPGAAFNVKKMQDGKFHVFKLSWSNLKGIVEKDTGKSFNTEKEATEAALNQGYVTELRIKNSEKEFIRITYPVFVFEYEMEGIDCMDIVIAETKQIAMKLFAKQWKTFYGEKVIKQIISTEDELEDELYLLQIKNINIYQISYGDLAENAKIAKKVGNPLTNPKLKSRQRNPRCEYFLGPNMKTGRSAGSLFW